MKQYCNILANVIVFTLLCSGCPDDSGETDDDPPAIDADVPQGADASIDGGGPSPSCLEATEHDDFTWIQANIFEKSCMFSSCHDADMPAGRLTLTKELAYAELMDVDSTQEVGKKRVVANSCENSYLYQKITNTNIAAGKKPMPPPTGGVWTPLCVEKQQAICDWIMAGAPNN
jgi:hypothetical protein